MTAPEGGGACWRAGRSQVDVSGHSARRRVLHSHRTVVVRASLIALAATVVPTTLGIPARAASISTLKAQAQAIATKIAADNARLSSLGATYINEHTVYLAASERAATTRRRIAADEQVIARDRVRVQRAVVAAYVSGNNGDASPLASWSSNPEREITTTTYLGVATNQLTNVVARFENEQHALSGSLTVEQRALASAATALTSTTAARGSVLLTVASEHQLYNSTNAHLNALVEAATARAEAAQARAAAAAVAQAAAAAAAAGPPSPAGLAAVSTPTPAPSNLASAFAAIRNCESSNNYALNSGNGYYGAYQFALSTWQNLGQTGLPSSAPPATQDAAALLLYQRAGNSFSPWPTCAAIAGLG